MKKQINLLFVSIPVFTTAYYLLINCIQNIGTKKEKFNFNTNITTSNECNNYLEMLRIVNKNNLPFDSDVEDHKSIKVFKDGKIDYCHYIDFINDNGYVIFDNNNIYSFKLDGDYPSLSRDDIVYSLCDGFLLFDNSDNRYYRFDIDSNEIIKDTNILRIPNPTNSFDDRDGELLNSELDSYISEVHPNWILDYTAQMYNFTELYLRENTFYFHKFKYYIFPNMFTTYWTSNYSEGNCGPTALATYLYNLPTLIDVSGYSPHYCSNLSIGTSTMNVSYLFDENSQTKDVFYNDYSNNYYTSSELGSVPTLGNFKVVIGAQFDKAATINSPTQIYWNVRSRSIYHDLTPYEGLTSSYYPDVINYVSSIYGYDIEMYNTDTISNVISNISVGIPVIITTSGSKTYGSHALTIYGYKKYVSYDWIVPTYHYIWLVMDGFHHPVSDSYQTWYDPNNGSTNTYFCTDPDSLV